MFCLSCVCPPTQVRICKVYMLVHYCGDPGACNNNEAKNLPSPFSSHPSYPKLRGLAAVWRGCCSFFSSPCSRVPCIFLFTLWGLSEGSLSPASEQTKLHPSAGQGEETAGHQNIPISFIPFIFSLHEKVLMEPRVGFCFQADSFAVFCFANGGRLFGVLEGQPCSALLCAPLPAGTG